MATATARVDRSRHVAAPPATVWPHVADVDGIVSLMESIRDVERLGDDRFRFRMRSYSALGYEVTPEAKLRLEWHEPERVLFLPVEESQERARAKGLLTIQDRNGSGSLVRMAVDLELEVPLPGLLAGPAGAVISRELRAGFDRFLKRLADRVEPAGST